MKKKVFPGMRIIVSFLALVVLCWGTFLAAGQDKSADTAVQGRIEGKFKQHGLLIGNDIQVSIGDKTVTLSGTVRTLAQKEQAGRDALSAAKGYKIVNSIALADAGRSLQQIAEGIMSGIEKSASYVIFDLVGVAVSDQRVATLKGWVYYPWHAAEFVKIAAAQPGVVKVENEIKPTLTTDMDSSLRLRIARLIYTRPTASSFARMNGPVHIIVFNTVVTLGGTVDKESDIDGYERLVRSNTPSVSVVNALQVKKR
jgi:osmotically-inducible protein OsmY